jgi:hypothetical protein
MIRTIQAVTVDNRKALSAAEYAHSQQIVEHNGLTRVLVIDAGKVSHVWRCPSLTSATKLVTALKRYDRMPAYTGPVVRLVLA